VSLSDVMSHSGLVAFTEVGLIVSLVAFLAIVAWVMIRPGREMEAEARKPLDSEDTGHEHHKVRAAGKEMRR
jgi:preprotein translocase subunit YajC